MFDQTKKIKNCDRSGEPTYLFFFIIINFAFHERKHLQSEFVIISLITKFDTSKKQKNIGLLKCENFGSIHEQIANQT